MSTGPKAAVFAVLLRIIFEAHAPGAFVVYLGGSRAFHDHRQHFCAGANQCKAVAGLLFHRPRRIFADGVCRAARARRHYLGDVLHRKLCGHERRRICRDQPLCRCRERYVTLDDYAGLGRRSPALAATLTIFLLSLIGIPMTGGFFAKFYVFSAALQNNLIWLVIIGVLNSAIGAYYYLRIIVAMYMREPREDTQLRRFRFLWDRRSPSACGHTVSGNSSRTCTGLCTFRGRVHPVISPTRVAVIPPQRQYPPG